MSRFLPFVAFLFLVTSCAKDIVSDSAVKQLRFSDQEYGEISQVLDLHLVFDNYVTGSRTFNSASKAALGRVLFYDKSLSEDGTISCGSCHHQDLAFADNASLSTGIYGQSTDRNSLALGVFSSFSGEYGSDGNPGASGLFWDQRVDNTHLQIVSTLANEKEMGMELQKVEKRISSQTHYEIL